ncbi:glycosyltransferase family 2 protein [Treponema brennaborense]|uniref:Glycosyl transferase family 2 n=1 Tax=Treponema brennaborense (strain DSM 12168 / CIP 105900 / DD5/3) TaxID=906968 RepID=F4LL65_TREBD|nr:glycosyltransferase family 2 protein [Treponema brennaborense]AEE17639.1 glycosyl transferase family 2 [Treponema brennaborense DSM 12168]
MKISIITVCYNSEKTIAKTIESVLCQKDVQLEYLIIDGASEDSTVEIAESYRQKFTDKEIDYVIKSEKDDGIYDAMNKGIRASAGDVIGILNSDDRYASDDVLFAVAKTFWKSQTETLYGNLMYIKNEKPYRYWRSGKFHTFKHGWMPPHPAFFVTKTAYLTYGMYRLDCGVNADYEFMLRLLEKERATTCWVNKTFVYMAAGGTSGNGVNSRIQGIVDNRIAWTVNGLKPAFYTVYWKKIRKIPQFVIAKFVKMENKL